MGCTWYLAMTAGEYRGFHGAGAVAWMACHFSADHKGICNLPQSLPPQSLILLDDSSPMDGHDPGRVTAQLSDLCRQVKAAGVILDLQRPKTNRAEAMVKVIVQALNCPVAVTEAYASVTGCPVLVSAPIHLSLEQVVKPWKKREIWLDLPLGIQTVDPKEVSPVMPPEEGSFPHYDKFRHCQYKTRSTPRGLQFTLCRNKTMLPGLLERAWKLGITKAVGLYQEYEK